MAAKTTEEKKVKITLPKTRENSEDVTVGLNGEFFKIKRGVEVEVSEGVYEILKNSEKMDMLAMERSQALAQQ